MNANIRALALNQQNMIVPTWGDFQIFPRHRFDAGAGGQRLGAEGDVS
jgi:hypothetical protein